METNVPKAAVSRLLVRLQPLYPDLPCSIKYLLARPKLIYTNMEGGLYVHFNNWIPALKNILLYNYHQLCGEVSYCLLVNIDGLPLFKHSPDYKLYPILVSVYKLSMRPICVGVYSSEKSQHRQLPSNDLYLKHFLHDVNSLKSAPLKNGNLTFKINESEVYICDAPCRSALKCIKSHSGYNSCERCTVHGSYESVAGHVSFNNANSASSRTNENFNLQIHQSHHKGASVLVQHGVKMVSHFILDYMHMCCLGVTKRLLTWWKGVNPHHEAKLSRISIQSLNQKILDIRDYIPVEFNRKMRPMSELSYWKAAEFRLFMLYAGMVILKDRRIISKARYTHFLKFCVAMRFLINSSTPDDKTEAGSILLVEFCEEAAVLYGSSFISYNVHSVTHLPQDYQLFGSLDQVSCFPFESYLGILKNCLHSGYKPLQQVSGYIHHQNENNVATAQFKDESFIKGHVSGVAKSGVGQNLRQFQDLPVNHYKKANLFNNSVLSVKSVADCTIRFENSISKVVDICSCNNEKFLVIQKYRKVKNLFKRPIHSKSVGVFKVSKLSSNLDVISLNDRIVKCFLLPLEEGFVAVEMIHST
ncbi:uncharacterized protein LOC144745451 [Ciona intestinalis]